jgi:hypothetical protein
MRLRILTIFRAVPGGVAGAYFFGRAGIVRRGRACRVSGIWSKPSITPRWFTCRKDTSVWPAAGNLASPELRFRASNAHSCRSVQMVSAPAFRNSRHSRSTLRNRTTIIQNERHLYSMEQRYKNRMNLFPAPTRTDFRITGESVSSKPMMMISSPW